MAYPMESAGMRRLVQALVSALLGLLVGFSVAFIVAPDPTGLLPIVVGLTLAVASTVVFHVGLGKAISPGPE
jgi:uncharacterized membrane protein YccC